MGDGRRLTTEPYFGDLANRLDNLEATLEYIRDTNSSQQQLYDWLRKTTRADNPDVIERRVRFLDTIDLIEETADPIRLTENAKEFLDTGDTDHVFEGLQRSVKGFDQILAELLTVPLSEAEIREVLARDDEFEGGTGVSAHHREWLQSLGLITETENGRYRLTSKGREWAEELTSPTMQPDSTMTEASSLYLAPCASSSPQTHFEETVATPVPEAQYSDFLAHDVEGDLRIWGVTDGNKAIWENINPGDYLLFYMGNLEYRYAAKVTDTEQNRELAQEIWPDYHQQSAGSDDSTDPFEYLIFLKTPFKVEIDSTELHSYAGYDQNHPNRFIPLNEQGLEAIRAEFASIEAYLDARRPSPSVWVEKTQIEGRDYKQEGEYQLGQAIMAPSRDQGGRKRYETLREADVGDTVLHLLQDQHELVGVSVIDSELLEDFSGPPDDRWTKEQQTEGGYLRWLSNYEEIEPPIQIYDDILENSSHESKLLDIRESSDKIFYDKRLSLNQGHYFTRCPADLVNIFATESNHLRTLLDERGYEFDSGHLPPRTEPYSSIAETTEDIQHRLDQTATAENWLTDAITETIIQDWTVALRHSDLVQGILTPVQQAKCEQVLQTYQEHATRLDEMADELGSGTIENSSLSPGQVLFIGLFRDLQARYDINPNLNHVKLARLLDGGHKGEGGEELATPETRPNDADTIARQLEKTGQLVFHGPPGTGKTYTARQFAHWWLNQQPGHTPTSTQLETVTFHPSFAYEDFIEGLTAKSDNGSVEYRIKDGVFKRICLRAEQAYEHAKGSGNVEEAPRYVLIVDEINRGNLAQIFGETMTLLEADKRLDQENEVESTLAHSSEPFTVPPNLYVIGTMNTADRSIALVDAALRRRFRFIAFPPNYTVLLDHHEFEGNDLASVRTVAQTNPDPYRSLVALSILALRELNERIIDAPDLGKGKQIGHSYLMNLDDVSEIVDAWKYEILPLIEEYYFGQFDRIREELFAGSGDRLFHWQQEEIADFTADDLRRTLATIEGITLAEPEAETDEGTRYTLNLLLEEQIIAPGDRLVFDESKVPDAADRPYDASERFWQCEVTGKTGQSDSVRWLHNDEEYSFSGLAQSILEEISEHTGPVTGPDYWQHPDHDQKRLAELRSEVQAGTFATDEQSVD